MFGDGRHSTTEVCLRILSQLIPDKTHLPCALDVGTGSGVLALAMGLMGFGHIVMTDLDEGILDVALTHLEIN